MQVQEWVRIIVLSTLGLTLGVALLHLIWGKANAAYAYWMALATVIVHLIASVTAALVFNRVGYPSGFSFLFGSEGSGPGRMFLYSFPVSFVHDSMSVWLGIVFDLVVLGLILSEKLYQSRDGENRVFSGVLFGLAGVQLAWISGTVWVMAAATVLVSVGAFVVIGKKGIGSSDGAYMSMRILWESLLGGVLVVLGASVLSAQGFSLDWAQEWARSLGGESSAVAPPSMNSGSERFGLWLVLLGAFFHVRPFPFFGSILKGFESPTLVRVVIEKLFPAIVGFALIVRLEPMIEASEVFAYFVWAVVIGGGLSLVCGLVQKGWSQLALLVAVGGAATGFGELFGAEGFNGFTYFFSWCLGYAAIAFLAQVISTSPENKTGAEGKKGFIQALLFILWFHLACVNPLLSLLGDAKWFLAGKPDSFALGGVSLLVFLLSAALSKLALTLVRLTPSVQWSWGYLSVPAVFTILSIAVHWVHPIPLGNSASEAVGLSEALSSVGIQQLLSLGLLLIALGSVLGWWLDRVLKQKTAQGKFVGWIASGYGIDRAAEKGVKWLSHSALEGEVAFQKGFLGDRMIRAVGRGMQSASRWAHQADRKFAETIDLAVSRGLDFPSRLVRSVQNGDVQWYLLFGLFWGVGLLVHFMRG